MTSRRRRTRSEIEQLRAVINAMAEEVQPCTVRQLCYLGVGRWWDKEVGGSRASYKLVVRLVGELREDGSLPWGWIADHTRWVRQDEVYRSPADALARWAGQYRRDLWQRKPVHVEVWCESDSIAGVLDDVTRERGVGLYVCRGHSSKTLVYEAVQSYVGIAKPVEVLYVGDHDPTGLAIPASVEDRVGRYGRGQVDVNVTRVAVTTADVTDGGLVAHGVNRNDSNYRAFAEHCRLVGLDPLTAVEVEALPPDRLRGRLDDAIVALIHDRHASHALGEAERSERELLAALAAGDTSGWSAS